MKNQCAHIIEYLSEVESLFIPNKCIQQRRVIFTQLVLFSPNLSFYRKLQLTAESESTNNNQIKQLIDS